MASITLPSVYMGCDHFALRLVMAVISGRTVTIMDIRPKDSKPGLREYEEKLLMLLKSLTKGTKVYVDKHSTEVRFEPGPLVGGTFTFDCGRERCISYFLEALLMVAPFCQNPVQLRLNGITNKHDEPSVDGIRYTSTPIFKKFTESEELVIRTTTHGFYPRGGGRVHFHCPVVKKLRPLLSTRQGLVNKIRGMAYVCKGSLSHTDRMIHAAMAQLERFVDDIFILRDHKNGFAGGESPGFGLILTAETTEGVIFHGEAMSVPRGTDNKEISLPEKVAEQAAQRLLSEMFNGGSVDSCAQLFTALFMTLTDKGFSEALYGPLSRSRLAALGEICTFFNMIFKVEPDKTEGEDSPQGSPQRVVITGIGIGHPNLSKPRRQQKKMIF